jgi:Ser/Thr protein kinase RdoA (MazF antagonist)
MSDAPSKPSAVHAWGQAETQFFYSLTPETILHAMESIGYETTGRYNALNSMENRVFDVEIYTEGEDTTSLIGKFYRPGRWTQAQILEEHAFLQQLVDHEIPVVAPIVRNNQTLFSVPGHHLWFCVFPKKGGHAPQDPSEETLAMLGRLLGRMHGVGKAGVAEHRVRLNPETYGLQNLQSLLQDRRIGMAYESDYCKLVEQICHMTEPWFEAVDMHRIHGDCHHGNVLYRPDTGLFFIDFDDMVTGPAVQDVWLLVSGDDAHALAQRQHLLNAYQTMLDFDHQSLRLIEPLRALRYIHFSAWISKRWEDPSFQQAFPYFGTDQYWATQVQDLRIQLQKIQMSTTHSPLDYSKNSHF